MMSGTRGRRATAEPVARRVLPQRSQNRHAPATNSQNGTRLSSPKLLHFAHLCFSHNILCEFLPETNGRFRKTPTLLTHSKQTTTPNSTRNKWTPLSQNTTCEQPHCGLSYPRNETHGSRVRGMARNLPGYWRGLSPREPPGVRNWLFTANSGSMPWFCLTPIYSGIFRSADAQES